MLPPSFFPGQGLRGPQKQLIPQGRIQQMTPQGLPPVAEKKNWIQGAKADIKKRGTEGVCTGSKFGSDSCPAGSKRYNLAKTFKKMAKHKK